MSFVSEDSERPPRVLRRPQKKLSTLAVGESVLVPTAQSVEAEAAEPKRKRLSRRVSFADTCLVTEFKTDGYGHGDLNAAEASSAGLYYEAEYAQLPQQGDCPDRQPMLSAASIQSLLTAPLASSSAFSGDGRTSVVLHAETTDIYEKPIGGEMSSSSEESRQTTGYVAKSTQIAHRSAGNVSTTLNDRPDRQYADATVYDVDASMQLTMCAEHHVVWDDIDDRAAQLEPLDRTVRFCDESMEMTMAEHKPIEVRPMTDCSNVLDGACGHEGGKAPADSGSLCGAVQARYLDRHDESEKENICSSHSGVLKAALKPTVTSSRVLSGRKEIADDHVNLDILPTQRLPCDMAFSPARTAAPLSTSSMDLTAAAGGLLPQADDCEATSFGDVPMDMTVPVEALIQIGQRGERSFRQRCAASETRYFADANMSMASVSGSSPVPDDGGSAAPAAAALFARDPTPDSDVSATTVDSIAISDPVLSGETELAACSTAVPLSKEPDDKPEAVEELSASTAAAGSFQLRHATMVIECAPIAVDVDIVRPPANDVRTKPVLVPASSDFDSVEQREQIDTSRARLGTTILDGGDLPFNKDSFSVDQHGSRMLSCHSDSTRSLLDAGRSQLYAAAALGHAKAGEVTVDPCYEDTAYLLRDSIRVSINEIKEELEEDEKDELSDGGNEDMVEGKDGEKQEERVLGCGVASPVARCSRPDLAMETTVGDVRTLLSEQDSVKHHVIKLPDNCDIIELALNKLHLRHDVAQTGAVLASVSNMSVLLKQLCGAECNDGLNNSNSLSDCRDIDSMRSLRNTYMMQPLEAQLRLACDQLVHHRSCLQQETEALEKQLRLTIAEPAVRDSDTGALLRQVLAADTDELPGLQEEFRSHHDRLHVVIEAKYDEWLFKCIRNIGDCWMESANLLDTYLAEIEDSVDQIKQKMQEGEELEKTLDAHTLVLQQRRLLEQPTTEELERYATQRLELDLANQEVLERSKALETLLSTKRDLGRRRDELEVIYSANVQKLKDQAKRNPPADVSTFKSVHVSSVGPSYTDLCQSGADMSDLQSNVCLDLLRAWTLESVTADIITVSLLDGSVTICIAMECASAAAPVDERSITSLGIQCGLSEYCDDAASLAVNGVISFFNENQIASKYCGSQLVKEMLLEISSVAVHMDELVAEILDARLERDCIISKPHDAESKHLVRLEVSFHNTAAATKFWLLLDFDALMYPSETFCITLEEDLGICSDFRHIKTLASSVRPGLRYLTRLIECVSAADARQRQPEATATKGQSNVTYMASDFSR